MISLTSDTHEVRKEKILVLKIISKHRYDTIVTSNRQHYHPNAPWSNVNLLLLPYLYKVSIVTSLDFGGHIVLVDIVNTRHEISYSTQVIQTASAQQLCNPSRRGSNITQVWM
ncbi:hypothetical protein ECG_07274 [Echinococcus granulosus]|uniref:Uncharacterized protein n=1 Tax=Echinococcus granulosus TaxID=6210 RepID=A0A068WW68_ECHGR|nr:hypothetical protein ECG_07274 [Echinococcus granulosus]CDS21945.1 hypothetical protein EgrG_002023100 [Echinococcus granulosus]